MPKIPPLRTLPLLAALALSLAACQPTEVRTTPPPARFERVTLTAPVGTSRCDDDGDGVTEPCLSQAQADTLFNDAITALCAANDKLAWLSDYYLGTTLPPSCAPAQD